MIFALIPVLFAQHPADLEQVPGKIYGNVFENEFREPVHYANIVLYKHEDNTQITGTITGPDGSFQLNGIRPGTYVLEISFIGYQTRTMKNIEITASNPEYYTGNILLEPIILEIEGAEVTAERPAISYEIDKKVINVAKQTTAVSGSAVDVLENVPSVDVDIEGNVSLRGSENFTVLIDGRPTILDPSDALQQVPASAIDNIEIITNPSARYDPEGISGIINIIMKKKSLRGISGILNMNAGIDEKYGGDFLVSYRHGMSNMFISANYRKYSFPGTQRVENITSVNDTASYVYSDGESMHKWNPYGLRAGIDLELGLLNRMSLSGEYGIREMVRTENLDYDEWTEPGDTHNLYLSMDNGEFSHDFYSLILDFEHQFWRKDHKISAQTQYSHRYRDQISTTELADTTGTLIYGNQNNEAGPSALIQFKLDYTLPLPEQGKFEAGYQGRIRLSKESTNLSEFDTISGNYVHIDEFSHATDYTRNIQALYTMFAGKHGAFGFQGGLRGEYTYRFIEMVGEQETYTLDRLDFFPSLHLSYEFFKGQQFMTSYTRRINRPRSWWLEPFLTWSDAYNVRRGNPDLKPEYIDSYELGFQTPFGKGLFSTEAYYRIRHNNVERVQSIYSDNVILHTVENAGTETTAGVEIMIDLKFVPWWNLNCTSNLYQQKIEGELNSSDFSREDFSYSIRMSNELKIFKSTKLQINARYRSPRLSVQGQSQGYFTVDGALKKEFFGKKLSLTLQARDLLNTRNREYTSQGDDFYYYRFSTRKSPVVMLGINYNFNNYKQQQRTEDMEQDYENMEEF
jgi:outer membrane receptor protein involved in Fe transport